MAKKYTKDVHFVQFTHPGSEHGPDTNNPLSKSWNGGPHKRKFLQSKGEYIDSSGKKQQAKLMFWGEWEPPSLVETFASRPTEYYPRWLHSPIWPSAMPGNGKLTSASSCSSRPKQPPKGTCSGREQTCENTDPYVFGPCFKYFVCKQIKKQKRDGRKPLGKTTSLAELEQGSLILFGSTHGKGNTAWFQLDTVFVVGRHVEYDPTKSQDVIKDPLVDSIFLKASFSRAMPIRDCEIPSGLQLRLYLGATFNSENEIYSFSPAQVIPSTGTPQHGFPRVRLRAEDLKDLRLSKKILTNNLNSAPKISVVSHQEAKSVWNKVREICRKQGLVEGVSFKI